MPASLTQLSRESILCSATMFGNRVVTSLVLAAFVTIGVLIPDMSADSRLLRVDKQKKEKEEEEEVGCSSASS